jgi:PKD repeat protein
MMPISTLTPGYKSGDLSAYPVSLDTTDLLYRATNNAETTLKQTLAYTGKVLIVNDTASFPDTGLLRVGPRQGPGSYEIIVYRNKTRNQFRDLIRAFNGSRQNVWPTGTWVANAVSSEHHNAVKDAILKIMQNLGTVENPAEETLNAILKELEVRFLAPKPLFRAYPRKGVPPLTVQFQNFSGGQGIRFLWDFGDGSQSISESPIHTFLTEGNFTIKLNIITTTGAQGIATKSSYIKASEEQFIPFFYVTPRIGYSVETAGLRTLQGNPTEPTTFQFVDQTDANIQQRFWVFDDGTDEGVINPNDHTITHVYETSNEEPGYQPSLLTIFGNQKQKLAFISDRIIVL